MRFYGSRLIPVAAAVIIRNGSLLICRRAEGERLAGFWEFPGGKIEPGETPQECIERELFEELGVESRAGEILGRSRYSYDHGEVELFGIRAELINRPEPHEVPPLKLNVHDEYAWTEPSALMSFKLAPADVPLAEIILSSGILNE